MKLKYVDTLPRFFPKLDKYPRGVGVKKGDILEVTEKDKKSLMILKNGKNPIFESMKKEAPKVEIIEGDES